MQLTIKRFCLILICGAMFAVSGCSKFLEEEDPSNLTPDNFYTLPEHADAALTAIYANLRFIGNGTGIFSNNYQLLEAPTGTTGSETGQNSDLNNLLNLAYNPDNLHVRQWWQNLYLNISNANQAIAKIPGINPMDEAQKARNMGEAYFLRALHYYWLVRLFGDVPLLTEPVTSYTDPKLYPGRTSQDSVYQLIVSDLTKAEQSGLPWTNASGRASLGAVKSLLASVYLTMAGEPLKKDGYFRLAADKAKEVIDNGSFQLFPGYDSLHNPAIKNTGELIFQIQYAQGIVNNPFQESMLPNFGGISAYGTQVGSTIPTQAFYDSFEPGDRRTEEQQFFYTAYYTNGNGALKQLNRPYIFKHFDRVANGTAGIAGTAQSGMNWTLIRYAEVLLIYAEAQNEADHGPNAQAIAALKQIRDRARLTTPTSFTEADFRLAVWRERWHELCYEGKTWFDMVRLRKAYNETTNNFDEFVGHRFNYGTANAPTLQEKHLLFPLPTLEYNNNPNLRPQNPGYVQ
ncbi:RagB/SusD family nutrient uptake outer membrane protein [uncultured Chitinophaga sp.]|jgi:SusD family.|uniref:RagB/SusD family nutrient uptake outer membrane protein n=1 Tax=uncultured Chitinophaga sp. TaxID=339340 RepID=UPI00261460AB|nr:RagB/SusD family nutrient uptake outer membrane protein [uncultured Chitinophaga sp.]